LSPRNDKAVPIDKSDDAPSQTLFLNVGGIVGLSQHIGGQKDEKGGEDTGHDFVFGVKR
jgi:hypothetical protein